MSWTDVFPVLTDEMVEEFQALAIAEERTELEAWYGIEKVFNAREAQHIVSFSLFWKSVKSGHSPVPPPTRELMQQARELGHSCRFAPWEHYVEPLLKNIPRLRRRHPDVAFRVHLARDLEFLVPDLAAAGCEVSLMKGSSIRFAPGGLWRYLPIAEHGKLITVVDIDRIEHLPNDINRTIAMAAAGLGAWRVPIAVDPHLDGPACYLPLMGGQMGMRGGLPVRELLEAFTWHCIRGSIKTTAEIPHVGSLEIRGTRWPDYGFDEWFLLAALYPRLAASGVLTLVSSLAVSRLLAVDIEYVTWANSRSQMIFFLAEKHSPVSMVTELPLGTC
jgi:hypothetical protein